MGTQDPSLPALSPREHTLLLALLDADASLTEVAKKHSIDDILTLVSSPAIRAALRAITDFNHLRAAAISSDRRLVSLDALSEIAAATTNPLERRRAATAFLRALAARTDIGRHATAPILTEPDTPAAAPIATAPARPSPTPSLPISPSTPAPSPHKPEAPARAPAPTTPARPSPAPSPFAPYRPATHPLTSPPDLTPLLTAPLLAPRPRRAPTTASLAAAAGAIPTG